MTFTTEDLVRFPLPVRRQSFPLIFRPLASGAIGAKGAAVCSQSARCSFVIIANPPIAAFDLRSNISKTGSLPPAWMRTPPSLIRSSTVGAAASRPSVTVPNNEGTQVNDWELQFNYPLPITSIWNAQIVSHTGNQYVIENAGWNANINPGGSARSASPPAPAT